MEVFRNLILVIVVRIVAVVIVAAVVVGVVTRAIIGIPVCVIGYSVIAGAIVRIHIHRRTGGRGYVVCLLYTSSKES